MGSSNAPYRHPDLGPEIEFPYQPTIQRAEATLIPLRMLEPRLYFHLPLRGGNRIEIILDRRMSKDEFEKIKKLVDLMEDSIVESEPTESKAEG